MEGCRNGCRLAHGRLANPTEGVAEMRQALAVLINKGGRLLVAFFKASSRIFELETLRTARSHRIDEALVSADQATNPSCIAFAATFVAQRNPPNIGPDAYRRSPSQRQGAATNFSPSLAKLHPFDRLSRRSPGRPRARARRLSPNQVPEIAEAQALLAAERSTRSRT